MTGIDGDGNWAHGGHGLHQSVLFAAGDVDEAGVVGSAVLGVVVAWLVVLSGGEAGKQLSDKN